MSENRFRNKGKDPSFAVFANFGENVATLVIKLIEQGNDMKYALFPSFSAIKGRQSIRQHHLNINNQF